MKKIRKITSLFLAVIIIISLFTALPFSAAAAENVKEEVGASVESDEVGYYEYSTFNARLDACKSDYPHGSYSNWQAPSGWYECWAYANQITYRVFGSYGKDWSHHQDRNSIYPGDLIRYAGYYGTGHSIVVTAVDGDTIYYTDRNGTSNYNMVRWGASINRWNITFASGDSGRQGIYHAPNWDEVIPWINPDPDPDPIPKGHVMSESEGAGRTIPDGDYWIISKIAEDYFVDIPGNDFNTYDKQNVQTWRWDSGLPPKYDVFNFTYLNNGFYKITQLNTNMAIDVYGADLKRGSNVSMWTYSGTLAQQWSIEKTSGGYRLRSRCNNYYMDITDGKHDSGTNILVWESHDGNNQRFSFIPYAPDEKPLSNGIYEIRSAVNQNAFLDAIGIPSDYKDPTNVDIWNGADGEKFQIEYAGNGYYFIREVVSGLVLDLNNDGEFSFLKDGRNVNLCTKNNKKNQLWKIKNNSDGTYCFINQMSGYYLDLENSNTDNGTNVSQFQYNGNLNQKWKLFKIGHAMSKSEGAGRTIPDGDYWIRSEIAQDFFLDIPDNDFNTPNGKNVQTWIWDSGEPPIYDIWHFEYLNNGFYRITQYSTKMCLQVESASLYCGTNVHAWEIHDSLGQQWSVEQTDSGYRLRARCNAYCLDIADGKHECGTNVLTWEDTGAVNQRFSLVPYLNVGDTNLDGSINIRDVTAIQRHLAELDIFGDEQLALADTNGDGSIDITDATHLQKYIAEFDGIVLGKS